MKTLADKIIETLEFRSPLKGPDNSGNFQTLCPFHDETRPSFSFHPERGYKCFACGAKGSVRMLAEHLDIKTGPLTIEQLAESKSINAQWLIDNKLVRQGNSGVEIPYLDERANLYAIRTRFNVCKKKNDNRFIWEKGKSIIPYGLWHLVHQKSIGYTILVEGETDCWTLWANGFNAIGIPGARNWKPAWAKYLKDFTKLYIWVEPDEAGRGFLADLVEQFPHISVLEGPGGIKDANELYSADQQNFNNSITQLMKDARSGKDVLIDFAKLYDMNWQGRCSKWRWDSEGIHSIDRQGKDYIVLDLKVKPIQILITPENRRFCHIAVQTGGHVCELYLADSWVGMRGSDAAKEMADYGVALTTKQVAVMQEFIGSILNEAQLPTRNAYRNLGWYENFLFTPGTNNAFYLPTSGLEWLKYYGTSKEGDVDAKHAWQYIVEIACSESPALLAALGAALASPFLYKLPATEFISFMLHLHTLGTGTGKTTILEAAAATVGDPRRICASWDSTKVGLEQMLGPIRHLPVFLNELGDAKYGVPEDAVMMISEETGRRRGTSGGGLRPTAEWRTIVLSTGNAPIAQGSAHHSRRIVSIPCALPSENFARECQEISHSYFGQPFKWCFNYYDTNILPSIREFANCYSQLYIDDLLPIKPQSSLWGLIEAGARMLLSVVGLSEEYAHESILKVAHASAIRRRTEGVDYASRIIELIQEDMVRDPGAYGISGLKQIRALRGISGRVYYDDNEEGDISQVAILPGKLRELTAKSNIADLTGALIECRERGILETGPDKSRLMKKVRVNEGPAWCYVFKIPVDIENDSGGNMVGTEVGTEIEAILKCCSHHAVFVPTVPT